MPGLGRFLILTAALLLHPSFLSAQSVAQVFDRVREAVVVVHTSHTEFPLLSREMPVSVGGVGSGVLVSPTEVLTAAHVVQAADEIIVEFPSGEQIGATVVASRVTHDVALLRLGRPASVAPLPLGDSDEVSVGDRVFVVGAPLGESHTLTVGHVSARRNQRGLFPGASSVEFLQTDAAINPGNSGGPMFDMDGRVIGIVSHILTVSGGSMGLGYAVSANTAHQVLREGPSIWSGLDGTPLTGLLAELLNVPPPGGGLLVQRVAYGSIAEILGLRPSTIPIQIAGEELNIGGDIILSVQGIPVGAELEGTEAILEAVAALPPGATLTVEVLRGGRRVELMARVQPRPPR